jgi:hypothetical protein
MELCVATFRPWAFYLSRHSHTQTYPRFVCCRMARRRTKDEGSSEGKSVTCTTCNRSHRGRYMRCYSCRQREADSKRYKEKIQLGSMVGQIAGEIVSRHIKALH